MFLQWKFSTHFLCFFQQYKIKTKQMRKHGSLTCCDWQWGHEGSWKYQCNDNSQAATLSSGWSVVHSESTIHILETSAKVNEANEWQVMWHESVQVSIFQVPVFKCKTFFLPLAPFFIIKINICALRRKKAALILILINPFD